MRQPSPLSARAWHVVPLLAVGITVWLHFLGIKHSEHVAELSRGESVPSATSPTGYAGGIRERVLSDRYSYEWIAQTQQMLARGEWRVRRLAEENAPYGRETHAASPYRWWLGGVAWLEHLLNNHPLGISVERAALYADPLLHLLILAGLTLFTARHAGRWPASLVALAGAFLFPFSSRFLSGAPDDSSLGAVCALGSLLPLIFGVRIQTGADHTKSGSRTQFALAGIFGGLGVWINPASQIPLTLGIALGGVLVAWLLRTANTTGNCPLPALWRIWSRSGAITVLVASLIEYYPGHLGGWELRAVHPLYGLAWLGSGELLARTTSWIQNGGTTWKIRDWIVSLSALAAVLTLPVVLYKTGNPGFLAMDSQYFRLTNQPGGIIAPSVAGWIKSDGLSLPVWATLLPLMLLFPAIWQMLRRQTAGGLRAALALAIGPLLLALGLAFFQVRSWLLLDVTLLVLLIPATEAIRLAAKHATLRWMMWTGCVLLTLLPGVLLLLPDRHAGAANSLSESEAVGLVERDLAHWLAKSRNLQDRPLILAPPSLTSSLNYYGGLKGVGTLSWENKEGLLFAIRIAVSTSREETSALLQQRKVTHIILPSWDAFFDPYMKSASVQTGELFYEGLNRWTLPTWLKPIPYQLPRIPGFDNQSVRIFEVVENQDAPIAASRLTEYFIEMGQLDLARISHQTLLKYPADFGVLVARAQLWAALNDAASFTEVFDSLLSRLASGADRYLPWDRRVSLAVVLSRGNRLDLARGQVERCLADLNEARLRSLTTDSVYHLLVMNRILGLEITDPALRQLALELLPAGLRQSI